MKFEPSDVRFTAWLLLGLALASCTSSRPSGLASEPGVVRLAGLLDHPATVSKSDLAARTEHQQQASFDSHGKQQSASSGWSPSSRRSWPSSTLAASSGSWHRWCAAERFSTWAEGRQRSRRFELWSSQQVENWSRTEVAWSNAAACCQHWLRRLTWCCFQSTASTTIRWRA